MRPGLVSQRPRKWQLGRVRKASEAWLLTSTPSTDERFPFQASVEFVFSSSPEKVKGKSGSWVC